VRARVAGRSWERVAASVRDVFEEAVHGRRSVIPVPTSVDARLLASFMSEEIQDRKVLQ